jgi:hypothetical protein
MVSQSSVATSFFFYLNIAPDISSLQNFTSNQFRILAVIDLITQIDQVEKMLQAARKASWQQPL